MVRVGTITRAESSNATKPNASCGARRSTSFSKEPFAASSGCPSIEPERVDRMIELLQKRGFESKKIIIDLDIQRDGNKLNIKTIKDGECKEFKFRDIYFKKINKDLIEKLHQRYCETH